MPKYLVSVTYSAEGAKGVRQDGGTEMWRYDGASCRAFFFFQGPAGSQAVRHVETLPAGAASAADPLCLSALRAARPAT